MKKLFTLLLVFACAVGGMKASTTIFIKPNGISSDNAVLRIKYWKNGEYDRWTMVNATRETALSALTVYKVTIDDYFDGMRFYRENQAGTSTWNESKDNQTSVANNTYFNLYFDGSGNIVHDRIVIPSTIALNGTFQGDGIWRSLDLTWSGTSDFIYTGTIDMSSLYTTNPEFKLLCYEKYFGYNQMTINANGWVTGEGDGNCTFTNSSTIYKTYTATATWAPCGDITANNTWTLGINGKDAKTFTASIGTDGLATFSNADFALDFSSFTSDFTAHIITAASAGNTVTASAALANVPANTGLLLQGNTGTYNVPAIASSSTSVTGNLLKVGTEESIPQHEGTGASTKYNYILTQNTVSGNADMKFYLINTAGNVVPKGKAYLQIGASDAGLEEASAPIFFNIDFGASELNGINKVLNSEVKVNGYYNLNGQRVANPTKGLYIVNGKKVIIK